LRTIFAIPALLISLWQLFCFKKIRISFSLLFSRNSYKANQKNDFYRNFKN